ncbi:MAG: hypothetical protein WCX63_08255 [Methanoregula sp.]
MALLAACPLDWAASVETGVEDETALPVDDVEVPVELVQPAIMIPAMRIADAINMTIMLRFME